MALRSAHRAGALPPADCADFRGAERRVPDGSVVLGDPAQVVVLGAEVEPGVVFDVRHGAVVLDQGPRSARYPAGGSDLRRGRHRRCSGDSFAASVFGPECRVRGEIAASVFLGFANKSHDGFVGHSVVGPWVNLGAGTTTSNLKNTYGVVRLEVDGERIETGRLNLGSSSATMPRPRSERCWLPGRWFRPAPTCSATPTPQSTCRPSRGAATARADDRGGLSPDRRAGHDAAQGDLLRRARRSLRRTFPRSTRR